MIVVEYVPETSKGFPRICSYFLLSIVLSCASILLAVFSVNANLKPDSEEANSQSDLNNEEIVATSAAKTSTELEIDEQSSKYSIWLKKILDGSLKVHGRQLDLILGVCYFFGTVAHTVVFVLIVAN